MQSRRFEAQGTFQARPEQLWPLLADTPRLNRAIGLPPIEYEITPLGAELLSQILPLWRWIVGHLPEFEAAREKQASLLLAEKSSG